LIWAATKKYTGDGDGGNADETAGVGETVIFLVVESAPQ
jgi:hypothetical protein